MATQKKTVKIFYHYHPADNAYARDFEKCLTLLKQLRAVSTWSNKEIAPGSETEVILTQQLELSNIVFLLVSRDFLAEITLSLGMGRCNRSCYVLPLQAD
jgi:hypothetical protein